MILKAVINTAD